MNAPTESKDYASLRAMAAKAREILDDAKDRDLTDEECARVETLLATVEEALCVRTS